MTIAAVLPPPNLNRFCELAEVTPEAVEPVFSGWTKYVLLTPTRAFLLPRLPEHVEPLVFEAKVLSALEPFLLGFVPRLLARHDDPQVWPFPFLELERMPGTAIAASGVGPDDKTVTSLFRSLGSAVGRLHSLDGAGLPEPIDRARLSHHLPDDEFASRAVNRISSVMALPSGTAGRWAVAFAPLAALDPVFVHGELGDGQLLHAAGAITAILDWDSAGLGPPLADLMFLEWAPWLFERHHRFNEYRRALWSGYADTRGAVEPELAHSFAAMAAIVDVVWHLDHPEPPPWLNLGTLASAVRVLEQADAELRGACE